MSRTHRIELDDPRDLDGEPFEVAREAVVQLAQALRELLPHVERVEAQLRNARMSDALELDSSELLVAYPEAVDDDGFLEGTCEDGPCLRPAEDPVFFYELTEDAGLIARLIGALKLALELAERLEEAQPPEEG